MIDTDQLKTTLQRELESLQTTREELRLQASLACADVRAELDQLEHKFERAQEEIARISAHSKTAAKQIEDSVRSLFHELRTGYERVRG